MTKYGVVKKDPSIEKNRDGTRNVIMLQCEIEDPEDIQPVEFRFLPGQTFLPQIDDEILIIPISESYLVGISSDDGITPTGNPGDHRFYSTYKKDDDSATIMQAFLELLSTGKITIQATDGNDPAVLLGSIIGNNDGSLSLKSTDSGGTDQAKIDLKNDGNLELNGNTDNVVSWTDLNTALQSFVSAINALFATKLDGAGTAGSATLDITTAKSATVKIP